MAHYLLDGSDFQTDGDLINFCNGLFGEASANVGTLHDEWKRNERYLNGKQWEDHNRASHRSKIVANFLWNITDQILATLNGQLPSFSIKPLNKNTTGKADILQAGVIGVLSRQRYRQKQLKLTYDAIKNRSGWLNVWWNPTLYDGLGDVEYQYVDPFRVYPDPSVDSLEDAAYFVDAVRLPLWYVRKHWGKAAEGVIPDYIPRDADGSYEYTDTDIHKQVSTSESGVSPPAQTYYSDNVKNNVYIRTGGLVTVKCMYVRDNSAMTKKLNGIEWENQIDEMGLPVLDENGQPMQKTTERESDYPTNWMRIVYTNHKILEFRPLPYWHGELPYHQVKFIENNTFWGMDYISQCISPQDYINRFYSDIADYLKMLVRPPLILDTRSGLKPQQIKFKDFVVLPVNGNPRDKINWFQPAPLSSEVFMLPNVLRLTMESVGNAPEVTQGKIPGSVRAASAIQSLQAAANIRTNIRFLGVEDFFASVIRHTIALMQQYYTTSRWARVKGNDGNETVVEVNPSDIMGEWEVLVEAGSGLSSPMEVKFNRLVQMMQMLTAAGGNIEFMKILVDNSGIPELSESLNNMTESQSFQNMAAARKAMELSNVSSAQGGQGQTAQG